MAKLFLCLFSTAVFIELSMESLQADIANQIYNVTDPERTLSRKRRYLTFPTGSSLQLVYCLTVPSVGMGTIFTLGHTAALAWELPDKPEELFDKFKKLTTTTEAMETTTTLPPLYHDDDTDYDHMPYDHPSERFDKPPRYPSGGWTYQNNKYPGLVNNRKTYYNPFLVNKPSIYGYSPVKSTPNRFIYTTLGKKSIPSFSTNRKTYPSTGNRRTSSGYSQRPYDQQFKDAKPVLTYIHPMYHQVHRRTRRDLYEKIEKLFTALSKDGKSCLLKAICEVSQVAHRKGSFMEEIIKAIFRVKPHDGYPDEDEYDNAANKNHNCTELYPTCEGSIWSSMLGY